MVAVAVSKLGLLQVWVQYKVAKKVQDVLDRCKVVLGPISVSPPIPAP